MNFSPSEFWDMSLRTFSAKIYGYRKRQFEKWRHTRYMASIVINSGRNWQNPLVTPEKLIKLPGDEESYEDWLARELKKEQEAFNQQEENAT